MPIAVAHGEGYAEFAIARQLALRAAARRAALRRQPRQADRGLPVQPERLAAGHHRPHDARRPLHDRDAASRARVPHRAAIRGIRDGWGEDGAVDADVPQRAEVGGLEPQPGDP